jgi:hypothetical protein
MEWARQSTTTRRPRGPKRLALVGTPPNVISFATSCTVIQPSGPPPANCPLRVHRVAEVPSRGIRIVSTPSSTRPNARYVRNRSM